jgi:hypothetical protein
LRLVASSVADGDDSKGFGDNDSDWAVYRGMVRGKDGEDSESEEEKADIAAVEAKLRLYHPDYGEAGEEEVMAISSAVESTLLSVDRSYFHVLTHYLCVCVLQDVPKVRAEDFQLSYYIDRVILGAPILP